MGFLDHRRAQAGIVDDQGCSTERGLASTRGLVLGQWVTIGRESCRRGEFLLLINHRDATALRLRPDELPLVQHADGDCLIDAGSTPRALVGELREGGFLTDRPAHLDESAGAGRRTKLAVFLSTLDARWTGAGTSVERLHGSGLRHAFHPAAIIAQLGLAATGLFALIAVLQSGRPLELRVEPWHVPGLLALNLVAIAAHELAHALVVVHYGRRVEAAGFRLHLGCPAFYVESVEALLLTRRQRMIQAAAGPWAEWLVTSIVALTLWRGALPFLVPVLHRFVLLNTATVISNLAPFVGLDGYLLFADVIREPELARRSRDALLRPRPTVEHGLLATYAIFNAAFAVAMLAIGFMFWFALFGGVIGALARIGPAGVLLAIACIALLFRPAVASLLIAVQQVGPVISRVKFRLERRWRVAVMQRVAVHPMVNGLSETGLGIAAGQIIRIRTGKRHERMVPTVDGFVIVARGRFERTDATGRTTPLTTGTASVLHSGEVLRCSRSSTAFILSERALELARRAPHHVPSS